MMVIVYEMILLGKSCEKYAESYLHLWNQREKDTHGAQMLLEKG